MNNQSSEFLLHSNETVMLLALTIKCKSMSNDFFPLKYGLHQTPPSSFSLHQAVVAKPTNQRKKEKMMNITIATKVQLPKPRNPV